jgi:hypothetical protein
MYMHIDMYIYIYMYIHRPYGPGFKQIIIIIITYRDVGAG